MENIDLLPIGILAGLFGSVITILLNRVFDMWQVKKEQKIKLQSIFFEKKLAAAEASVIKWSSIGELMISLSVLYRRMKEAEEFNYEVFNSFNDSLSEQLQNAIQSSQQISHSILLYFDLKRDHKSDEEAISDLYKSLSKILNIVEEGEEINDLLDLATKEEKEFYDKKLQTLRAAVQSEFYELSIIYDKAKIQMAKSINQIRNDMKKYDI